jgi:predicted transcriptional regulator
MERTTVMLPHDLRRRLKQIAAERDVSMATVIREALEEKADKARPKPRSFGIADSGRSDISQRIGDEPVPPLTWR